MTFTALHCIMEKLCLYFNVLISYIIYNCVYCIVHLYTPSDVGWMVNNWSLIFKLNPSVNSVLNLVVWATRLPSSEWTTAFSTLPSSSLMLSTKLLTECVVGNVNSQASPLVGKGIDTTGCPLFNSSFKSAAIWKTFSEMHTSFRTKRKGSGFLNNTKYFLKCCKIDTKLNYFVANWKSFGNNWYLCGIMEFNTRLDIA